MTGVCNQLATKPNHSNGWTCGSLSHDPVPLCVTTPERTRTPAYLVSARREAGPTCGSGRQRRPEGQPPLVDSQRLDTPSGGRNENTPERTRTSDLRFRKPPLCPAELRAYAPRWNHRRSRNKSQSRRGESHFGVNADHRENPLRDEGLLETRRRDSAFAIGGTSAGLWNSTFSTDTFARRGASRHGDVRAGAQAGLLVIAFLAPGGNNDSHSSSGKDRTPCP